VRELEKSKNTLAVVDPGYFQGVNTQGSIIQEGLTSTPVQIQRNQRGKHRLGLDTQGKEVQEGHQEKRELANYFALFSFFH
jgi:predicted metal-dependent RNase